MCKVVASRVVKFVKCTAPSRLSVSMWKTMWNILLVILIITAIVWGEYADGTRKSPGAGEQVLRYGRDLLLSLRPRATPTRDIFGDVPSCLVRQEDKKRPRKRGRRGGIRQRLRRRPDRPPLPSIIFSNVRSLRNKLDELRLNTRICHDYREACVMAFTETWFQEDFPDQLTQVQGFTNVRLDRDGSSGKRRGGGVCVYIKDSWCTNYAVKDKVCSPDLELLCLSLRPFYLPRDFGNIFVCVVYIPPSGNAGKAASRIADCVHQQLLNKPDAPMFVLGDFNHCNLNSALPGFQQYVRNSTRKNKILDRCYGNVEDAYAAKIRPPLSNSDHNTIQLIPTFKPAIKKSKPVTKTVSVWADPHREELSGCFFATDWEVFHQENELDCMVDVITDYIHFCVDTVVPKKTIKIYPNHKDYVTSDIKDCIKRKRRAFRNNDTVELKTVQKELKWKLKAARDQHSLKIKEAFLAKDTKNMWECIKDMTNLNNKERALSVDNEKERADDLNIFYKRFDTGGDGGLPVNVVCGVDDRIVIDTPSVIKAFKALHIRKASGPDRIPPLILHNFAWELSAAWCPVFQLSVDTHTIPTEWKRSIIIPVPKKPCPRENNDFRPVALTSVIMKSFERVMLSKLRPQVQNLLDPYQFAYKDRRSTGDALCTTSHLILKHLENSKAYARLLFMDFSSAFNTIIPTFLLDTLKRMEVNPAMIKWYEAFLTRRTQQVRLNSTLSDSLTINIGVPQGCVSSPLLFTLYTNECRNYHQNNFIIKFSDDTAILSLLMQDSDISGYQEEIDRVVRWCDSNKLVLNATKTKEIIFDPKSIGNHTVVTLNGEAVEQVATFKYLGILFDSDLKWGQQVEFLCSRISQRLHFLRRLRVFGIDKDIMMAFYRASIESIIRYGITVWFGNLSVKLKAQLQTLIKRAGKIMGMPPPTSLQVLFDESVMRQGQTIAEDQEHILHGEYELLPSGRRYRLPNCKTNRFKFSVVPWSIRLLNSR